jgi:hypothetical protein
MANEVYLIHAFVMPKTISYFSIAAFFTSALAISAVVFIFKTVIRRQMQKHD